MLCNYSINKALGLPDIFLIKEKIINNKPYIYLFLPQKTHICPQCHKDTSRIHDYLKQFILDLPIKLEETTIVMKKRRYQWFKHEVEYLEMKEFQKHLSTLDKWFRAVENGVIIGISNGFVEGCNNRTKVLKRICYGFRNFKTFRNRLLCIANNRTAKKKRRLQLAIS